MIVVHVYLSLWLIPLQKMPLGLLDLPPELWANICKLVVQETRSIILKPGKHCPVVVRQPGITKVCRAIREESLPHFYRENQFCYLHRISFLGSRRDVSNATVRNVNARLCVPTWDVNFWTGEVGVEARIIGSAEALAAIHAELDMITGDEEGALEVRGLLVRALMSREYGWLHKGLRRLAARQ